MITKNDLKVFEKLVSLWLQGNLLTFLEPDLFKFSTKLKYVDLSKNHFKTIPAELFNAIDDLEQIKVLNNFCISTHAINREQVYEVKREITKNCQEVVTDDKAFVQLRNDVTSLNKQVSELKESNVKLQRSIDAFTTFQ